MSFIHSFRLEFNYYVTDLYFYLSAYNTFGEIVHEK